MPLRPQFALLIVSLIMMPRCVLLGAEPPDFARDVRPILSQHCFKCHGPDENSRQAGLRLDDRASALMGGDSQTPALVPAAPDKSELISRITTDDPDLVMPPPSTKRTLTAEQVDILRQWVSAGANFSEHWAFQSLSAPEVPAATPADANPIDSLVADAARRANLPLAGPTDRGTWLRRIYLDLIGLPPEYAEVVAFTSDQRADAEGRVIDRLLASPALGERWARRWLDMARYADTNGYEKDRPRSIWPYRDWVITAINEDLPQSQFALQQLAGDMLDTTDPAVRIATGFHRNTMTNEEGGIDPLEYRYYAMVDRVNTTGTAWLGLTMGCVQCHDHKYDPISQADYYGLMALLNDVEEPEMEVHDPQIAAAQQMHDQQIETLRAARLEKFPVPPEILAASGDAAVDLAALREQHLTQRYSQWLQSTAATTGHWTLVQPTAITANLARLIAQDDGSWLAIGDISKRDEYMCQIESLPAGTTAIMLEALTDPSMPRRGPGRTYYEGPIGDFFLSEVKLLLADQGELKISQAFVDFAQTGREAEKVLDGDPLTGWSIDGQQGLPHRLVLRLDQPLTSDLRLTLRLLFERYYAAPLGRIRLWSTRAPLVDARAAQLSPEAQNEIAAQTRSRPGDEPVVEPAGPLERKLDPASPLVALFLDQALELADQNAEIRQRQAARPKFATTLIMQPRPAGFIRPTHRYHRGEFLSPREVIEPAVPQLLRSVTQSPPRDRAELADWLFAPRHPLTARVLANRYWSALIGRGLVSTEDDFGFQGSFPSNQPLLDWLALQLINSGSSHDAGQADDPELMWSLKRWMRLVLASQTYGRSAELNDQARESDPSNIYLSRANRRRLEAEQLRDAALSSAGLIDRSIGGPSVYPPQPASITTEGTYGKLTWPESHGGDRYRRGLYTFSKRTAPFAMLATFDAPSGEACLARRESTDTPLQALTVLNDSLFIEAAQELGYRIVAADPQATDQQLLQGLFQRVLLREPSDAELADLEKYFTHQLSWLSAAPESLKALGSGNAESSKAAAAGAADQPNMDRSTAARVAAATLVARVLLNTDEFINRN